MQAEGRINELLSIDGLTSARITCAAGLCPAPGKYVLAHAHGSDAPLASALFAAGLFSDGFVAAPPIPSTWSVGTRLHLRGPLGHGFEPPGPARRFALIALDCAPGVLLSLLAPAVAQNASVTLVARDLPDDLAAHVEVQPPQALQDVCRWADYVAIDADRESLPELRRQFEAQRLSMKAVAQVLVRTPMPCGALAACGVCTVDVGGMARLACDDGPVFDFRQLMGWASSA